MKTANPECKNCHGSGWVVWEDEEGCTCEERCTCWKARVVEGGLREEKRVAA